MSRRNQTQNRLHPREYDAALFVNRERELALISRRINLARTGALSDSIINFWGIRGTGKSWLMQHIHQQYQLPPAGAGFGKQTFSILYAFEDAGSADLPAKMATELAGDLLLQLDAVLGDEQRQTVVEAGDHADVSLLIQGLRALLPSFVPVLLFDNTELLTDEAWQQVEQQIIEPLVVTNRVLCVVSGRESISAWHRFETRRRVKGTHNTLLQPFDKATALQQIEKGGYRVPLDIGTFYTYTAGSPLLLDKFAQELEGWNLPESVANVENAEHDALVQHQAQLLDLLRTCESDMLGGATEWLPVLNVLSPLRFYRSEALRFMMKELDVEAHPEIYYLDILRQLDQHADVVWWDRTQRAYVTSPIVRRVMNRRQCLDDVRRERYVTQHRRALFMYQEWIRQYPRTSEDYICELWFHQGSIYLGTQDLARLQRGVQATLALAGALRLDSLNALSKQFEEDRELRDLLPAAVRQQIQQELSNRLRTNPSAL